MQSNPMIYGVDVASDELVVARLNESTRQRVANSARELRAWLRKIAKGSVLAMESTGTYHQLLARLAHQAGMQVYVLNARRVYFYARALEVRGKTDGVDAGVIARYVAEHREKLHQWLPPTELQDRIDGLVRRRSLVVVKREALRQSLRGCNDLQEQWKKLDRAFGAFVRSAESKLKELVKSEAPLALAARRIESVIGFGPIGSALLAVLLERIPFASSDSLVAYSGWDPRADDSGRRHGKRKLTKCGPAYLRKQWYMVGFTAARTRALKPMYLALRAKGFATTEAFVILARKLLRAAYAVWKTNRPFSLEAFLGRALPA